MSVHCSRCLNPLNAELNPIPVCSRKLQLGLCVSRLVPVPRVHLRLAKIFFCENFRPNSKRWFPGVIWIVLPSAWPDSGLQYEDAIGQAGLRVHLLVLMLTDLASRHRLGSGRVTTPTRRVMTTYSCQTANFSRIPRYLNDSL